MAMLKRFLCFDTRRGSVACGLYTSSQSLALIFLDIIILVYLDLVHRSLRKSLLAWDLTTTGLFNAAIVSIVFSLMFFITCILLIYGVSTKMRKFMYPWLAFMITSIGLTLFLGIFVCGSLYYEMGPWFWAGIFGIIIINLFHIYCVLCVISYHQQLTNGESKS